MPPGRIPVETYAIEGNESGFEEVYKVCDLYKLSHTRIYTMLIYNEYWTCLCTLTPYHAKDYAFVACVYHIGE